MKLLQGTVVNNYPDYKLSQRTPENGKYYVSRGQMAGGAHTEGLFRKAYEPLGWSNKRFKEIHELKP